MLVLLTIAIVMSGCHSAQPPRAGDTNTTRAEHPLAAEFSLPDLSGRDIKLSDYRGRVVLLDFWATWCEPCRTEIPQFVRMQEKYGPQGFQIIGVSMDDQEKPVREFYRGFKMNYPVVMGNAKLAESFGGIFGLPVALLIGRDGRIYGRHIGETATSLFEKEVTALLENSPPASPSP